jgi:hypothetical protein
MTLGIDDEDDGGTNGADDIPALFAVIAFIDVVDSVRIIKTDSASLNLIPCFAWLARSFAGSQSMIIGTLQSVLLTASRSGSRRIARERILAHVFATPGPPSSVPSSFTFPRSLHGVSTFRDYLGWQMAAIHRRR